MDRELLSTQDIAELIKQKEQTKITLIYKYCLKHKLVTWHILCIGGLVRCLECYLEELIREIETAHSN